jgi:hypothetical protein
MSPSLAGAGFQEVLLQGDSILQEPFINETVLWKENMSAEIQIVSVVVNELQRQHVASLSLNFSKRKLGRLVSSKYPIEYSICQDLC